MPCIEAKADRRVRLAAAQREFEEWQRRNGEAARRIPDIALPRVDGLTVIRALRGSDATTEISIITGLRLGRPGMHAKIIAAGADVALEKPCLPEELDAEVRKVAARRGSDRLHE